MLIVDDKPENIIALEALLQRDDINLISTTSPNEALKICWEKDISIALVDVQMPEMDGFELVEILKSNARTREMLIVFVTAISIESRYAIRGLSAGAVDYLYKPLEPNITIAKVDSFIQLVRVQREIQKKNRELENYQKELIKAKEDAEAGRRVKEKFLANMSHELRTPVNGIIGLAHLLGNSPLTEDQKKYVGLMKLSSEALLGVINDVLDFSKIEAGKFKIVRAETNIIHLSKAVADLLKFKADEKSIRLSIDISEEVPQNIIADSLRLNQILMNLIGNAIKFTERGEVVLRLRVLNRSETEVQLQFSVQDSGIGISEDKISKIFESFEQAEDDTDHKYGGTGLGLSIVKKLAELKGGELKVESEKGKGSTFSFTNWFKVVNAPERPQAVRKPGKLARFENISVLVAEDNTVNQFMIKKVLTNWNLNVEIVENGEQVLECLKNYSYDIILMDTHMPVMGGYETTRRIRNDLKGDIRNIPIISLTAAVLEEETREAFDAGVNDVVTKPFDPEVLHRKIEKLVMK